MHISEGVLSPPVLIAGWAVTVVISGACLRKLSDEELPRAAVMTSAFFVGSLIHIPLGPFSAHLVLNGLVGVILGRAAYPSILLGLALQAVLFQHGGLMVLGANAVIMGLPSILAYWIFRLRPLIRLRHADALLGFLAGALGTLMSGMFLALFLATSGEAFSAAAKLALAAHFPVMLVEGLVTAGAVSFLARVKPEILRGSVQSRVSESRE